MLAWSTCLSRCFCAHVHVSRHTCMCASLCMLLLQLNSQTLICRCMSCDHPLFGLDGDQMSMFGQRALSPAVMSLSSGLGDRDASWTYRPRPHTAAVDGLHSTSHAPFLSSSPDRSPEACSGQPLVDFIERGPQLPPGGWRALPVYPPVMGKVLPIASHGFPYKRDALQHENRTNTAEAGSSPL